MQINFFQKFNILHPFYVYGTTDILILYLTQYREFQLLNILQILIFCNCNINCVYLGYFNQLFYYMNTYKCTCILFFQPFWLMFPHYMPILNNFTKFDFFHFSLNFHFEYQKNDDTLYNQNQLFVSLCSYPFIVIFLFCLLLPVIII